MSSQIAVRKGHTYMVILPEAELAKKNVKNLLFIKHKLHRVIGIITHSYGPRCCEVCHEYIGDDWQNDVGVHLTAYQEYMETIKRVLATKPHEPKPVVKVPLSRANATRKNQRERKTAAYYAERGW